MIEFLEVAPFPKWPCEISPELAAEQAKAQLRGAYANLLQLTGGGRPMSPMTGPRKGFVQ
jgi:hypothetical protein